MKYILFCVLLCITYATASFFESKERSRLYKENKEMTKKIINNTNKIDSLIRISDSLSTEIFIEQTNRFRYELSLEYLREVNPKATKQFENYLYTQTE